MGSYVAYVISRMDQQAKRVTMALTAEHGRGGGRGVSITAWQFPPIRKGCERPCICLSFLERHLSIRGPSVQNPEGIKDCPLGLTFTNGQSY